MKSSVTKLDSKFFLTFKSPGCFLFFLLAVLLVQCSQESDDTNPTPSAISTDLGASGNDRIRSMYQNYHDLRERGSLTGCHSGGNPQNRVIIQGFSAFQGIDKNLSGVVASAMANREFWGDSEARVPTEGVNHQVPRGSGESGIHGASAFQRTIQFGGKTYEICFLVLDVLWDFAPAVVLYESQKFQPHMILMSGVGNLPGTLRIETGAVNRATPLTGFDPEGNPFPSDEVPLRDEILPRSEHPSPTIQMTWKPEKVLSGTKQGLAALKLLTGSSFQVKIINPIDAQNDYICNNTSYITLAGLLGKSLPLAGGQLMLSPPRQSKVIAGFLHYPPSLNVHGDLVFGFAHVLMNTIENTMQN